MRLSDWIRSACVGAALALAVGPGSAAAETLDFGDAPAISPSTAWSYFQSQGLASPTRTADPLVTRTANALGNDPDRIFAFVHDEIEVVPLFGVQKGARGALIDNAGTPFDQAHLLAELMRAAGYQAEYVLGTITLSQAEMSSWLGVDSASALAEVLADGGIPFQASGGNYTLLHLWVRVTIGGQQYVFDSAYKAHSIRAGALTQAGLDAAMGFNPATFMSQALAGASSTTSGAPQVANFNRDNARASLQTYSSNLLSHIEASFAESETADVIGGRDIVPYTGHDQATPYQDTPTPLRQTTLPYQAGQFTTFANDVPLALRTQTTITVTSSAGTEVHDWTLDQYYGEELAFIMPQAVPLPTQGPQTYRLHRNGQPAEGGLNHIGVGGYAVIHFNHPYAANGGAYIDRDHGVMLTFYAGPVQIIVGGGRMTPDFGAYIEARSSYEDSYVIYQTPPINDPEPIGDGVANIGAQRATKRRYAASFASQFSSAIALTEQIGDASIASHSLVITAQTLPVIDGVSQSPVSTLGTLSVSGSFLANARSGQAPDTLAVRRATAALAATLEGSAVQQGLDSVYPVSTTARMDWSSSSASPSGTRRFYWANEANWAYVSAQILNDELGGGSQIRGVAAGYIANGYTLIIPQRSDLGPGEETVLVCSAAQPACLIPGPERGGAFVALSPTGVAHVVTAQGNALAGGGGTDDAEINPGRIFSVPDDFLERQFTARAEAHNVDLGSGVLTYTPAPDLVVGEGSYPYSLSFQRSFRSNDVADHSGPPDEQPTYYERLGDGWTSNFMAEARMGNDGQRAFGDQSPREATDTIAAIRVLLALNGVQGSDLQALEHQLGAIHALAWWSEQLSYNSIEIVHGGDSTSYFRLADGTFQGPPGDITQVTLLRDRITYRKHHTAATRWLYRNMCVEAHARDGSISYYGPWLAGYSGCDANAQFPPPIVTQPWMRFRGQVFREGVVVDFNGTTLSNNLGRSITLSGGGQVARGAQLTLTDDDAPSRAVGLASQLDGSYRRLRVTGTDQQSWLYDYSGRADWRAFAPSSASAPIVAFEFAQGVRGQVEHVTDAAGNEADYFISTGRVGAIADPLGQASRTYFDARGQPVRVVNRLNFETRTAYDALRRARSVTYPEGNGETYAYDDRHNRISTTGTAKPDSLLADIVTTATFDALCNMPLSGTDARGNSTTYALVPNRCLIATVTQPAVDNGVNSASALESPITTYTWNSFGQLVTRTDPTGRVTTNAYNGQNYLASVTAPGGALTQFGRNATGDITSVTDPRGNVHTGTYDLSRRLTRYDGPAGTGAASEWRYNVDGLIDRVRQATGQSAPNDWSTTTYAYWETGRVRTMTDPDGGVTQYFYDALNRLDYTLDPVNRRSEPVYDAEGQMLQDLRGVGSADQITYATRTWTPNGHLDWVEDANANRSDLLYDGFDRLSRLSFPSATTDHVVNTSDYEEYGYDANGNRTSARLRSAETIRYRYDALNRECFKDLPSSVSDPEEECGANISGAGASDVFSGYDLAGRRLYVRFPGSFAYDDICATSYNGVDYCYDAAGRVSAERSYDRALTFAYDLSSNRTRITYPSATTSLYVDYVYDPLNRVTAVRENGAASGAGLVATYAYDQQSRRTQVQRAGGAGRSTTYEYSLASRLTRLDHGAIDGTNDADWSYAYTDAGQVESRTLIEAYEWAVGALDEDYEVNGLNQYSEVDGATFTHDTRGNLTDTSTRRYCYDLENRLAGVAPASTDPCASPLTMALQYDPLGRLRQTVGTATTQFLYDGDRLVAEYDGTGVLQRRYVHGPGVDEPLVWYEGDSLTARRWLITDRQGSVIAAVDGDGDLIGAVYRYGPYGEPDDINGWAGSRFRYTGQIALPEAGLYHYKARVYHPGLGRFLQTDPVGYAADINLYLYAANDPFNQSDPSGLSPTCEDQGASSCRVVYQADDDDDGASGAQGPGSSGAKQQRPNQPSQQSGSSVRPYTANEAAAATQELRGFDPNRAGVTYDAPPLVQFLWWQFGGPYTLGNVIHAPRNLAHCQDFTTCGRSIFEWFMHESTHVYQNQLMLNPPIGILLGHGGHSRVVGNYLTFSEYLSRPHSGNIPPPLLSTEQEADWHMWHASCELGLRRC